MRYPVESFAEVEKKNITLASIIKATGKVINAGNYINCDSQLLRWRKPCCSSQRAGWMFIAMEI